MIAATRIDELTATRDDAAERFRNHTARVRREAEADFETSMGPEVERYLATDSASARDRASVFHLAWDVACSAFGGRQVLYERFFGGDPVRNAMLMYTTYDREPAMQRVREFLDRKD